jgi:hypothetical protein
MATTVDSGGLNWNLYFGWTDDMGTQLAGLMNLYSAYGLPSFGRDINQGGLTVGSFTFRAVAGQPVTYSVSGSSGGPYELFLTIEKLP